jgi:hypothetical protein
VFLASEVGGRSVLTFVYLRKPFGTRMFAFGWIRPQCLELNLLAIQKQLAPWISVN